MFYEVHKLNCDDKTFASQFQPQQTKEVPDTAARADAI